ncbi:MAG: hypothetical protein JW940_22020, partial [Polyangiaceae bacterium]|nr:hypothetical protein [Polyangiaceae bacterium]
MATKLRGRRPGDRWPRHGERRRGGKPGERSPRRGEYFSSGTGEFFDFNGAVDAGALLAGSWGISRLIDALEVSPLANIDPRRLAVCAYSMFGKCAVTSGALDARIALTISHDAGLGGDSSWRVSQADFDAGLDVQTLESEAAAWAWFRNDFGL